jgi:hypothetical protein
METYIDLGAVVYEFKHCKGIFARSKSTMEAIRSMLAVFHDLPDDTRYNASADSSNKIKILEQEVTIDDCKQSLQTISPILSLEGTDTQCINQKAHLMSEQNQLSPDWVAGLEGETVICEDVTIRLSSSLPILERCLNVTCVQCENGKSTAQLTVPSRLWHMTRIQTRISHVHKTASIHQRGTLLRLCYCGVLRAGAPPAML